MLFMKIINFNRTFILIFEFSKIIFKGYLDKYWNIL
jgi:hypothetical protein